jgi:hypothetical protein
MIVIGTMGIPFTSDKGTFYCPRCRDDVAYRGRHVRRFLTLYFIPLVPLDKMEEYVECLQCKNHFPREALQHTREQATQAFQKYVRHALTLVAAEDEEITQAEVSTFQDLIRRLTGNSLTADEAHRELQAAQSSRQMPSWYLRTIGGWLTREEKKTLVQFAFLMASASGQISEARSATLAQFPAALGLTEDEFKQFVAEAAASG